MEFDGGKNAGAVLSLLGSNPAKIRVIGVSMKPCLEEGDEVEVIGARKEDFKAGDLVVFNREGELIVHRIIRIKREAFFEMGDNQALGTWREWREKTGKVVGVVKKNGELVDPNGKAGEKLKKKALFFQKLRVFRSSVEKKAPFYALKKAASFSFRFLEYLLRRVCFT